MATAVEYGGVAGVRKPDAWVDPNFVSRSETRRKDASGNIRVAPKGATLVFPLFPVFSVP